MNLLLGLNLALEGVLRWTPTALQTPSTNTVTVRLGDDGDPSLAVTVDFQVIVRSPGDVPDLRLVASAAGAPFVLEIRGRENQILSLESSDHLVDWSEVQRLTGLGRDTPVRVSLPAPGSGAASFWRVRTLP